MKAIRRPSGDTAASKRILGDSRRIAQAVRLDDLLAQLQEPPAMPGPAQNPLLVPTDTAKGQPLKR